VDGFREFAFMMGAGVMLETFLVRPLLIPALVALFGEAGTWPSRGFGRRRSGHPVRVSGGGESA
jgi:RND superfamily putative drug exporter